MRRSTAGSSGVAARALYLGQDAAVRAVAARLGGDGVAPANPCWVEHGLTFADPDGFGVVLVPERWAP